MTTEEHGDYIRGARGYSSSSSKLESPTSSYAPRGTYATHYKSTSSREDRGSPYDRSTEDSSRNPSPQHYDQGRYTSYTHNSSSNDNKRKTPNSTASTCTDFLIDEWAEDSEPSISAQRRTYHNNEDTSSSKRARYNSDETCADTTNDTRYESKYGNRSDYYEQSRHLRDEWAEPRESDRGLYSHRERDAQGRSRYEDYRRESNGYHDDRQKDSCIDTSIFCKKKLWVGGLPASITCEELRKYFEAFGDLIYVMISPKGNAFVKYASEEQALSAYRKCYTAYIKDKQVRVKYAIRKANKIPHNKLLYINNVPSSCTRTDLKKEFERYGEIEDVQMFTVPYFFVSFVSEACAVKARKALKTKYFIQFGKIRAEENKKVGSPDSDQTAEAPSSEQPFGISNCQVGEVLEPLTESQTLELSDLLSSLQPTNSAIRVRRDWIIDHVANMNDILLHISVMLVAKDNPFTLRLSTLFLVHDLLSYCTQRRVCTEILDTVSALTLPHLQRVINKFRVDSEEESKSVLNILSLWKKYSVFPVTVVEDMCCKFTSGKGDTDEL